MPISHNPPTIAPPAGLYSHGVETEPGLRTLYISGQLGVDRAGAAPVGTLEQAQIAWSNIVEILKSAGMEPQDIVKLTTYLVDPADAAAAGQARSAAIGDHAPASTMVVVAALLRPEWKIEIEVVAARPERRG